MRRIDPIDPNDLTAFEVIMSTETNTKLLSRKYVCVIRVSVWNILEPMYNEQ